ncbi:meiosis-specific protein MEI4-like isoform X1 [Hippocampus zosterae]|uniref:meiosis-specific protein MEI4-like isoform X1 n=1 Tax=Hippocampus zosterae TaxID=109293 RepID=UPI00223DB7E8|nr:meiosis-specific protein MEI4-like isoform X1 [Hippocampus zosterae]
MERRQGCFLAKVSVAVAVAVIGGAADGATAARRLEALVARLRDRDRMWRAKAEELQREVLGLRRALLIATATASTGHDAATESQRAPDSDSDTPELHGLVSPRPRLLSIRRQDAARLPHQHVLHALGAFQRPGAAGQLSEDELCRFLDALASAFRERSLPPGAWQITLQACRASSRAMDEFSSQSVPAARLTTCLRASLRELAATLLRAGRRQPMLELLTQCLAALGRSRMAKSFLVAGILSEVGALADALCRAIHENAAADKIPVDEYHNALRLLRILEELPSEPPASRRRQVTAEQAESLQRLQQQMFDVSPEFPLFALTVWRVSVRVMPTSVGSSAPNCP